MNAGIGLAPGAIVFRADLAFPHEPELIATGAFSQKKRVRRSILDVANPSAAGIVRAIGDRSGHLEWCGLEGVPGRIRYIRVSDDIEGIHVLRHRGGDACCQSSYTK